MKTETDDSWIMNHKSPLSVTIHLPGTSPISGYQTEFLLSVKDISILDLEQRCLELRSKIQHLMYECFSKELLTELPSHPTHLPIGNGAKSMALSGLKVT